MLSDYLINVWKYEAKRVLDRTPGKCPVSLVAITRTTSMVTGELNGHVSDASFRSGSEQKRIRAVLDGIDGTGTPVSRRCARGLNAAYNRILEDPDHYLGF